MTMHTCTPGLYRASLLLAGRAGLLLAAMGSIKLPYCAEILPGVMPTSTNLNGSDERCGVDLEPYCDDNLCSAHEAALLLGDMSGPTVGTGGGHCCDDNVCLAQEAATVSDQMILPYERMYGCLTSLPTASTCADLLLDLNCPAAVASPPTLAVRVQRLGEVSVPLDRPPGAKADESMTRRQPNLVRLVLPCRLPAGRTKTRSAEMRTTGPSSGLPAGPGFIRY